MFSFPKHITIIPGAVYTSNNKTPYGKYEYDRKKLKIITHPAYKGISTRRSDFGIIILPDDSIFKQVGGFLDIDDYDQVKHEIDTLMISGYPGDKDYGTQWTEMTEKINDKNGMIIYGLYTHTGLSGAPILYKRKMQNQYFVVGIHNTGSLNGTTHCNAATKIDNDIENLITDWIFKYSKILD
ncbi:hypothetical protein GCM10027036_07870 [Flavihumibacter cheonanensis]